MSIRDEYQPMAHGCLSLGTHFFGHGLVSAKLAHRNINYKPLFDPFGLQHLCDRMV